MKNEEMARLFSEATPYIQKYGPEPRHHPERKAAPAGASEPEVLTNVYFTKIASVPKQRVGGD